VNWAAQAVLSSASGHERATTLLEQAATGDPGQAEQRLTTAEHRCAWAAKARDLLSPTVKTGPRPDQHAPNEGNRSEDAQR
jgi:hypothetical protein